MEIIFEDREIIVVNKPAGMLSQGNRSSDMDAVSYLKNYLSRNNTVKGEPYIGLIHRLDRPVGGVMVFAKTKNSAAVLSKAVQNHQVVKKYRVVLTGKLEKDSDTLTDYLVKDAATNLSRVVGKDTKGSKLARLDYRVLRTKYQDEQTYSLVEINLLTGRHHQIRVQMAHAGAGVFGDTKYNKLFKEKKGYVPLGLFSCVLEFKHPRTNKLLKFSSEPTGEAFSLFT